MKIVAYDTQVKNNKLYVLESTEAYVAAENLTEALDFLIEPYEETIKVSWELDAFVAPLLALLGKAQCIKLHQTHKAFHAPYKLFYIPGKIFSIDQVPTPHHRTNLYDLAQYYPDMEKPEVSMVHALGMKLLQELKKMGLEPSKLTSPVAIYEECVMRKLDLPKVSDMPKEAAEFAYRCSGRLWIEAYQLGYWE